MILSRVVDESGLILRLLDLATGVKHRDTQWDSHTLLQERSEIWGFYVPSKRKMKQDLANDRVVSIVCR